MSQLEMGKNPHCYGSSSNKSKGSVLHKCRKFGFGSYILSFEFGSMRSAV